MRPADAIRSFSVAQSLVSESVEFWIAARSKSNLMQMTGGIPDSSVRELCKLQHHAINKAMPSVLSTKITFVPYLWSTYIYLLPCGL
jgi:hypothetical protein